MEVWQTVDGKELKDTDEKIGIIGEGVVRFNSEGQLLSEERDDTTATFEGGANQNSLLL